MTRVNPLQDTINPAEYKNLGLTESALYLAKKPFYNVKQMKGMPVGVQICGRRWEDEKLVGLMRLADNALGPRGFGPGAWDNHKSI